MRNIWLYSFFIDIKISNTDFFVDFRFHFHFHSYFIGWFHSFLVGPETIGGGFVLRVPLLCYSVWEHLHLQPTFSYHLAHFFWNKTNEKIFTLFFPIVVKIKRSIFFNERDLAILFLDYYYLFDINQLSKIVFIFFFATQLVNGGKLQFICLLESNPTRFLIILILFYWSSSSSS